MAEWYRINDPEHPAPKDGTPVDLWAKKWFPDNDEFKYQRFTSYCWKNEYWCQWEGGARPGSRCPPTWRVTHWMAVPEPPEDHP